MLHLSIFSKHNYSSTLTNCTSSHCFTLYFSQFLDLYFNLCNLKSLLPFFIPVLINSPLSFIHVLLFLPVFDIISLDSAEDGTLFFQKFLLLSSFPYFYSIYWIKFTFNRNASKKRPPMHCIESLFLFISVSSQEFVETTILMHWPLFLYRAGNTYRLLWSVLRGYHVQWSHPDLEP